jgi:hypothetical protein
MDSDSSLTSIDNDDSFLKIAKQQLGSDGRLRLAHIPQNDQVVATCIAFMTAVCHLKKNISITFLY